MRSITARRPSKPSAEAKAIDESAGHAGWGASKVADPAELIPIPDAFKSEGPERHTTSVSAPQRLVSWAWKDKSAPSPLPARRCRNRQPRGLFWRLHVTVGAKVMWFAGPQSCVLLWRPDAVDHCRLFDLATVRNRPLPAHLPTTKATPAPHQHGHTHQPHSARPYLSVVPLPSPRTIQIQHTTALHRRCVE
jgi:hypothetical protein